MCEALGEWQGPAIWFYNSIPAFTSNDLDCFTRSVGDSAKAGNSAKIGQFGLGAITAYHFTDVIQLLSGKPCSRLAQCERGLAMWRQHLGLDHCKVGVVWFLCMQTWQNTPCSTSCSAYSSIRALSTRAGAELLFLDPHAQYLPDREESVNANLFEDSSQHFFHAQEAWPGTVAPFLAVTRACADVMAPLELPDAPASGQDDREFVSNGSPPAPVPTPDNHERPVSGEGSGAERQDSGASASELKKRKRDSLTDDEGVSDGGSAAGMSKDDNAAGESFNQ